MPLQQFISWEVICGEDDNATNSVEDEATNSEDDEATNSEVEGLITDVERYCEVEGVITDVERSAEQ